MQVEDQRRPAAIQHEGAQSSLVDQKRRKCVFVARFCAADACFSLRSVVRVRTCSARRRPLSRFSPFSSPSPVAVHYMPLEECRRGAAKRERVLRSAHGGRRRTRLFFFGCNFSRSGCTVSCTSVRASLRIGGKGTTGLPLLPRPTSKRHLITSRSDFFLTPGCQICLFCQLLSCLP